MNALRTILQNWTRAEAQTYFSENTRSQYLGDGRVLCQILGDQRIIALGNYTGFTPHMIFDGYWEYWLTKYFADTLVAGNNVLDIGANHGYFTILAGNLVGPTGKLWAYEPNPDVYECLRRSVTVNGLAGQTEILNAAIMDVETPTSMQFLRHIDEPHNGRLLMADDPRKPDERETISTVQAVSVGPESFDKLDLIKIDVEGAELNVLDAISGVIEAHNPIVVCEVNFHRGYSYQDVAERLGQGGRFMFLDFDAVVKPFAEEMVHGPLNGVDLLAVRLPEIR